MQTHCLDCQRSQYRRSNKTQSGTMQTHCLDCKIHRSEVTIHKKQQCKQWTKCSQDPSIKRSQNTKRYNANNDRKIHLFRDNYTWKAFKIHTKQKWKQRTKCSLVARLIYHNTCNTITYKRSNDKPRVKILKITIAFTTFTVHKKVQQTNKGGTVPCPTGFLSFPYNSRITQYTLKASTYQLFHD